MAASLQQLVNKEIIKLIKKFLSVSCITVKFLAVILICAKNKIKISHFVSIKSGIFYSYGAVTVGSECQN